MFSRACVAIVLEFLPWLAGVDIDVDVDIDIYIYIFR